MKTRTNINRILFTLVLLLMGFVAQAAYSDAPTLSTSGSSTYSSIATVINSWKNAWTPPANASSTTSAFWNRSAIIDQVEATLLAAGKGTITDAEYDTLADALCFWLHKVASEGRLASEGGVYGNNRAGWYITGIGIPEWMFGKYANPNYDYNDSQCVWELRGSSVPITGTGTNGYGPMLGSNTRMVLFVSDAVAEATIKRNIEKCNVMFSTNGVNSKLLILGRKNHKVRVYGGQNWADPSSYSDVLARSTNSGQRGQEVVVNGGSLMTAYTTFDQNLINQEKCSYRHYAVNPPDTDNGTTTGNHVEGTGGTVVSSQDGGAISVLGDMNCCSFYYTNINNNSTSQDSRFGGGISFRGVTAKVSGTDGNVYFNHCTIKGNRNGSHGGGVAFYYLDAADGRNVYFKNTEISYNCQKSFGATQIEAHGGGFWVVNAYNSDLTKQRRVFFENTTFTGNYSNGKTAAGGAISNEGTISLTGCAFNNNVADNSFGGAIYNRPQMAEGATKGVDLTVSGCSFTGNQCTWTSDLAIDGNDPNSNPERGSGGAIMIDVFRLASYAVSENYVINLDIESNCSFSNNHADRNGGAVAVAASNDMASWLDTPPSGHGTLTSNMEIKAATMTGNTAGKSASWGVGRHDYGGAVYLSYTNLSVTGNNTNVQVKNNGNTYTQYGGAVAIYKGNLSLSGGTFGASGNANKATYGGAFYINQGTVSLTGGNIQYNTATEQGGGLYTTGNGTITVSGVTLDHNTAKAGGGIFTNNSAATNFNMTNGTISNNSATAGNGGGVCLNDKTILKLSTGSITGNSASANGGGVYLGANGALELSGSGTITSNSASSGQGGGVYMGGSMMVDGTSLNVSNNTIGRSANNVYLPSGKTIDVGTSISPNVTLGIYTEKTYDTYPGDIPVLTTTAGNEGKLLAIYSAMTNGQSNIRDDRGIHKAKYTPGDRTLYFTKVFFDYPAYTSDFSNPIDSKAKLYQFMCWVNGVNGYGDKHSDATGNVTADIDMTGIQYWIPIGEHNVISSTTPYIGNFNGNGHIISNLSFNDGLVEDWGVFGAIDNGAVVTDVFVQGVNFATKSTQGSIGSLIGDMKGGTVKNCIGSGTLTSTHADCVIGGLVGRQEGGTIHSSSAMSTMTGYQMGGVVGDLASGSNLYNSFANARFTPQSGSTKYIGGLVGVNAGRIENCYSRIQNTSNPSANYFGWIAGQNNSGTITYCYMPVNNYSATYVKNGTAAGNTCTTYGATSTPYLYKHADNQMTANGNNGNIVNGTLDRNGLKGLLATLNKWVGNSSTYSKWMRTSASPINSDYPIHEYSNYVCVASKDNIKLEYSADFNGKFNTYLSGNSGAGEGTIYLYKSPTATVTSTLSNSSKATELYIHEDVVLLHTSAIKAHVGITLDNSAGSNGANPSFGGSDVIDWHFFSSALTNAPIGLVYGDQSQYNLGVYPSWHATFNNANGYFPTNLNDVVSGDDYYEHWDLYGYCEPEYHWINYKRNSASHWHEDWPGIHIYPYSNDVEFVPGRGYMVALKDEGYLQAYGTLNTNSGTGSDFITVPVTYTPSISWTTREGHNLLGNPYQSYLDFWEFARDSENQTLWSEGRTPFYIIIDEDKKDYVLYTVGQSPNPQQASRFLHPHQGFMIDVDKNGSARFSNAMRTTSTTVTSSGSSVTWSGDFRGGEDSPCYPLVNLMVTDDNGNRDIVTVELGRPDKGGAVKEDAMRMGKGSLWCRYEDEDYALVFTQPGLESASIRFACDEDAQFTMTWSTHNGAFSYLHLIDNMTGNDIDCLQKTEYTFTAKTTDYVSRFRLVFDYTGVEENEGDGPSAESETFAYYADGEIHLAEPCQGASLQIIDMQGRVIVSGDAARPVSTNGMAAGVYVLRLTSDNGTRTQKIILN